MTSVKRGRVKGEETRDLCFSLLTSLPLPSLLLFFLLPFLLSNSFLPIFILPSFFFFPLSFSSAFHVFLLLLILPFCGFFLALHLPRREMQCSLFPSIAPLCPNSVLPLHVLKTPLLLSPFPPPTLLSLFALRALGWKEMNKKSKEGGNEMGRESIRKKMRLCWERQRVWMRAHLWYRLHMREQPRAIPFYQISGEASNPKPFSVTIRLCVPQKVLSWQHWPPLKSLTALIW